MTSRFIQSLMFSAAIVCSLGSVADAATMNYLGDWANTATYKAGSAHAARNTLPAETVAPRRPVPEPVGLFNGLDEAGRLSGDFGVNAGGVRDGGGVFTRHRARLKVAHRYSLVLEG